MTSITDILAMELPHGYSLTRHDNHSPWRLLLNGEMLHHTSKYNKDGWFVFLGEEGDEKHIQKFSAAMNAPTQEAILGKKLAECLDEILCQHDGNQSPAMNMPELDYARYVIRGIHRTARAALAEWNKLEGVK